MRSGPLFHFTGLAAALALAVPSSAAAQRAPDPNSPAGVEYALPLDQAREQARGKKQQKKGRGGNQGQQGGKGTAPLFGEGITKGVSDTGADGAGSDQANGDIVPGAAGSAGNGSGGSGSKGSGSGSNGSGADGKNGSKAQAGENGANRTAASVADGGSQTGLLLGVVAGVLLLGGLLGLGLRLGFGRSDS